MKTFTKKIASLGVAAFLLTGGAVYGDTLYQNTTHDSGYSLNFTNGLMIGNEIILDSAYPSAYLNNFSFEIYSSLASFTGVNVQMQVFLFDNTGTPFNGFATPNNVLYNSGVFTLQTPLQYSLGSSAAVTLSFDLSSSPVLVNSNFTFAAVVTGLAPTDSVGFELFTNGAVGQNYNDYWRNDGTSWSLATNSVPTSIGAQFQGVTATPEPATVTLMVVGTALLAGATWRRKQQAKQG